MFSISDKCLGGTHDSRRISRRVSLHATCYWQSWNFSFKTEVILVFSAAGCVYEQWSAASFTFWINALVEKKKKKGVLTFSNTDKI